MEVVSESSPSRRDRDSLVRFLEYCRGRAGERGRPQFASISLRVKHISPLAVLQSIFEPSASHFYLEKPAEGEAIAGAEAVWQEDFSGTSRFTDARQAMNDVLENTICIGDLGHRLAGPRFFFFYTFFDDPEEESGVSPGTVFLPRWQVAGSGGNFFAVANLPVSPDSPVEIFAEKVLAAHSKFQVFDYPEPSETEPLSIRVLEKSEVGTRDFESNVEQALLRIGAGDFEKLVLSRALDFTLSSEAAPLDWLSRLREKYRECFSFSVSHGGGESFVGLTPELLLRVEDSRLETEALAGSAPRGQSAGEDARFAGELLASGKDLHEHQLVADSIVRRLGELGVQAELDSRPGLRALPNVQHLLSRVAGRVPGGTDFWQLLRALHPTPAVGGTPRDNVMEAIAELEAHPRGLYAGALGWAGPDGEGQAVVAIRSGLVRGTQVRLYAGAGIVEGSEPKLEKKETDLKLQVLLEALG